MEEDTLIEQYVDTGALMHDESMRWLEFSSGSSRVPPIWRDMLWTGLPPL